MKISVAIMMGITVAACLMTFLSERGRRDALRANEMLALQSDTMDAVLEVAKDAGTGDIYIRVNGEYIHHFPKVCGPTMSL